MLFLSLEYQLFLVLALIFSSFILLNSFTLKMQSVSLKAYGLTFVLPLILSIAAFIISPYNKTYSMILLFLGNVFLAVLLTIISSVRQKSESLKLFFLLPFILCIAVFFLANSYIYNTLLVGLYCIILLLVIINLALLVHAFFQKNKDRLFSLLGAFMISSSLGIWLLSKAFSMEALFLIGIGYASCTLFFYKNTLGLFFIQYKKNHDLLHQMNTSIHTEVIRRVEEIERSNRKLLELSKTDSMTGLYVKSAVIKSLEAHIERSSQSIMSILMFDIDKFKQINDTMGHQVGDKCIKTLSGLIQTSFRKDDILGRYGGDEFIVLLPSTSPVKAYLIADRFRQLVQSKSSPQMTVSIGISSYPEDGGSCAALIEAADKALYESKQKGRNVVTLFTSIKK